ncbi:MAG: hypothetical protein LBJ02_10630 [Bifidobacteriaceae bacterium]|jgi:hypothetical protein|nr:hypothetical protein [Bifidobacteriaceae bacterium]
MAFWSKKRGPKLSADSARLDDSELVRVADAGLERHNATLTRITEEAGLEEGNWDADLAAGTFAWHGTRGDLSSRIQVLGTRNPRDNSFLWGWDHPSVSPELAEAAKRVKDFGQEHEIAALTTRKIQCTQDQARLFGNVAIGLGLGEFTYLGTSGPAEVYLILTDITIAGPPETQG